MAQHIERGEAEEQPDGIDRRGFLKCMAWAGTGIVWTVGTGGLLSGCSLPFVNSAPKVQGFTFVQLSDSHIGFSADGVNTDVTKTLQMAIDKVNTLPQRPGLVVHTGDLSHMSKPSEFDTVAQLMGTIKTDSVWYTPGEHDVIKDQGAAYRDRFSKQSKGKNWYSVDYNGVHFVGLANVQDLDSFGVLGAEQIDWLKKDLQSVNHDTPVVIFAHVPLYAIYPQWGWTTKDSAQALDLLKPYASVTVLNGHIHQVQSQVEGNMRFFTANSTAFPQRKPGDTGPGAYKLPAGELLRDLGYRTVTVVPGKHDLAIVDTKLSD